MGYKNNRMMPKLMFQRLKSSEVIGVSLALVVLILVLTFTTDSFLTQTNLFNVSRAMSFIAIAAVGELFVIIAGGIDISVGSIMGLSGVVTATLVTNGVPVILGVLGGILSGLIVGLINSVLIAEVRISPIIVTLGMLSVVRGLAYYITEGKPVTGLPDSLILLGRGSTLFIPNTVLILILVSVISYIFLNRTTWGTYIFAHGNNELATAFSGINTKKIKYIVYTLSGVFAALSGVLLTARLGVSQSTQASGYELDVIAAVFIGGATMGGGKGNVWGVVVGAVIMGLVNNGLVLWNISPFLQQIFIGIVIILAVSLDILRGRRL